VEEGPERMEETTLLRQAEAIASLMPLVARGLMAVDNDDAADDLPLAQLRVCGVLEEGPQSMSALSRELGMSLSAMTQIADRLVRSQWVCRVAEGRDRRVRHLRLTPHGVDMMRARKKARVERILSVLGYLSAKERTQVLTALEILWRASQASRTPTESCKAGCPSPSNSSLDG
jgi:DNA-binding MarR family transcriptional regulator